VSAAAQSVCVWDLAGTPEKRVLAGHAGGVTGVTFGLEDGLLASASKDRTVCVWDPVTGKLLRRLADFDAPLGPLACSPDGRTLAAADAGGTLRMWDVGSGRVQHRLTAREHGLGQVLWCLAFSPDGNHLAACGHGLTVWQTGATLRRIARPSDAYPLTACFNPGGNLVAWAESDRTVHLWDLARAGPLPPLPARLAGVVHSLAFYPDGRRLTFISAGGDAEVWDALTAQRTFAFGRGQLAGANALGVIALSPDGAWLATQSAGSLAVAVWDTARGEHLLTLPAERGTVWPLSWSPDGARLAVGRSDGGLVVWDLVRVRAQLRELGLDW
jgi:WD40 repeat protein